MLELRKGGKLFKTEHGKRPKNITKQAIAKTYEPCELAKDVTLRDVFLLLNTELDIFNAMLGNWCKEIVQEGLSKKVKSDGQIHYLELYWMLYKDRIWDAAGNKCSKEWNLYGNGFPQFHGWGDWQDENKTIGGISVCFSPSYQLMDIPLKLSDTMWIVNDHNWKEKAVKYDNPTFTLGQILYGIVWELSFHGSPKSTQKTRQMLTDTIGNIEKDAYDEAKSKDQVSGKTKRKSAKRSRK